MAKITRYKPGISVCVCVRWTNETPPCVDEWTHIQRRILGIIASAKRQDKSLSVNEVCCLNALLKLCFEQPISIMRTSYAFIFILGIVQERFDGEANHFTESAECSVRARDSFYFFLIFFFCNTHIRETVTQMYTHLWLTHTHTHMYTPV